VYHIAKILPTIRFYTFDDNFDIEARVNDRFEIMSDD
jgi:hypothetical protein